MSGNNLDRLSEILSDKTQRAIPVQVFWGKVKEVDWEKKVCTVTGLGDELEFYNVNLGLKNRVTKPKTGSRCLIGAIENNGTDLYLIDTDEFEEMILISKNAEFHISESGFTVKNADADLKEILLQLLERLGSAIIQTPSGPGNFSPGDQQKFLQLSTKTKKLFE